MKSVNARHDVACQSSTDPEAEHSTWDPTVPNATGAPHRPRVVVAVPIKCANALPDCAWNCNEAHGAEGSTWAPMESNVTHAGKTEGSEIVPFAHDNEFCSTLIQTLFTWSWSSGLKGLVAQVDLFLMGDIFGLGYDGLEGTRTLGNTGVVQVIVPLSVVQKARLRRHIQIDDTMG